MISSMTGFGVGTFTQNGITSTAEVKSLNSRFYEVNLKIPKVLTNRENEIKDLIKNKISRGKVNAVISFSDEVEYKPQIKINKVATKNISSILNDLKKIGKIKENLKIAHFLNFSEIFEPIEIEEDDSGFWPIAMEAIKIALDETGKMRLNEGEYLKNDFQKRIISLNEKLNTIENIARNIVDVEREKLRNRIKTIIQNKEIDENRLEMEIALLVDRLDITEECVRFHSHNDFFLKSLDSDEQSGRKLTFLTQEMNREINTIGSKTNDVNISHLVVDIKEELEKIREQLQNIE